MSSTLPEGMVRLALKLFKASAAPDEGAKKKKTALHELGHVLGLAHSYVPNVMYEFSEQYTG